MNKVILMGRLTRDPDIRSTAGDKQMVIARYSLAVDRRGKDAGADFIPCIAFDKNGEFAEKYLRKGMKIAVTGRIQTGSYKNKDGQTVYTTDVIVDEQEFAESKSAASVDSTTTDTRPRPAKATEDMWTNIPDGIDESELPFGG